MLGMVCGFVGVNASSEPESAFAKCIRLKKSLVALYSQMPFVNRSEYMTLHNKDFGLAFDACSAVKNDFSLSTNRSYDPAVKNFKLEMLEDIKFAESNAVKPSK